MWMHASRVPIQQTRPADSEASGWCIEACFDAGGVLCYQVVVIVGVCCACELQIRMRPCVQALSSLVPEAHLGTDLGVGVNAWRVVRSGML